MYHPAAGDFDKLPTLTSGKIRRRPIGSGAPRSSPATEHAHMTSHHHTPSLATGRIARIAVIALSLGYLTPLQVQSAGEPPAGQQEGSDPLYRIELQGGRVTGGRIEHLPREFAPI